MLRTDSLPNDAMSRPMRWLLGTAGAVSMLLGIIGLFLPIFPTTPFLILTAACWAKASPRWHRWLLSRPYVGPMITRWERERTIPRGVRWLAVGMLALSMALSAWLLRGQLAWLIALLTLAVVLVVVILRLPVAATTKARPPQA